MVSGPDRQILVVEDHDPTTHIMARLIRARGFHVVTAVSMAGARAMARSHTIGFLITDLGLPDGDGCDLMRELHDSLGIKGAAVSGYGMPIDLERSTEAGFAMHLTKPVHINDLERVLALARSELVRR